MALSTQLKSQFIYDLLLKAKGQPHNTRVPVRLKLYIKDIKLYVDSIQLNTSTMSLAINGDKFGQYIINLENLTNEVTYEFDY